MNWVKVRELRGLTADIENKPGTYGAADYTHPKLTAIGCKFLDEDEVEAWCLPSDKPRLKRAYAQFFRDCWDRADFVIGHNFRRHDMKILDGLYTSLGLPLLTRKKIVDTYLDQPKMVGFSRSLENLAARWDCPIQKMHLSEYDWERAYDGIAVGVEKMRQRVSTDVLINEWLYKELIERKLLKW